MTGRFFSLLLLVSQRMNAPIESFGTSDGTAVKGLA